MIKQEIYNVLLKVSLYFFILFLLLFVVDLLFAVTDNAIDCTTGTFCSIKPGYSFYEITLMILGGLIVVFMILARVFHYLVRRYDDLIDVNAYKQKYQQSQQAFSESELYQSTNIEKDDSVASILLKSAPSDDEEDLEDAQEITIDDLEELPDLEEEDTDEELPSNKVVVEDLMADEVEEYKRQKELERQAQLEKEEALKREQEAAKKPPVEVEIEEEIEEDFDDEEEISVETLGEESAIDQLAVKDIKERLYKDAIIVTEEEIKEKLKDQSKTDVLEELRKEKEAEKEREKQEKLKAQAQQEKEEPKEEVKEEVKEEPKETVKETKATPVPKKAKKKKTSKSKKDLIEDIAEASDLSKNKSEHFLNTMIDVITEAIKSDDEVDFGKVGKFSYIIMPAKDAVNPQTKEKIVVPEHKEVRFRFDEDFKEEVNNE